VSSGPIAPREVRQANFARSTHQCSPSAYYKRTTVGLSRKFIDHDDKVSENKLSEAFEWTSKKYQEAYSEIYSECTCWYCETVRSSHVSVLGKAFSLSKSEKRIVTPIYRF
jgi:hypothetical protein